MALRETVPEFQKAFQKFPEIIERELLNPWNIETQHTLSDAQERAPIASGRLVGSGARIGAKITRQGIISFLTFRVPYASKLNDKRSGIRLKEAGEISYRTPTVVRKQRKGELGYLDNAVIESEPEFQRVIDNAISRAWDII